MHLKSDERILRQSDFVESVLRQQGEVLERKYRLKALGYDWEQIIARVAELFDMPPQEILQAGKQPLRVQARSLVCYLAASELKKG